MEVFYAKITCGDRPHIAYPCTVGLQPAIGHTHAYVHTDCRVHRDCYPYIRAYRDRIDHSDLNSAKPVGIACHLVLDWARPGLPNRKRPQSERARETAWARQYLRLVHC